MNPRRTDLGIGNPFPHNSVDLGLTEPGEEANDAGQELSVITQCLKLFQIFGGNPLCRTLRICGHFSRLGVFPFLIEIDRRQRIVTDRVGDDTINATENSKTQQTVDAPVTQHIAQRGKCRLNGRIRNFRKNLSEASYCTCSRRLVFAPQSGQSIVLRGGLDFAPFCAPPQSRMVVNGSRRPRVEIAATGAENQHHNKKWHSILIVFERSLNRGL